jgi:5-methyltetrahydrofolate--homocysteine methyltransferase
MSGKKERNKMVKINRFLNALKKNILILDGAMGTELQKRGFLDDCVCPEELNIKSPEKIQAVHQDYLEAGSQVIFTNTFGANRLKLSEFGLEGKLDLINRQGIRNARTLAEKCGAFVGADVGPIGAYISPLGNISFDEAYNLFAEQVKSLAKEGPDLLVIETMAEIREVKAAILAAKDNYSGPVFAQMTFNKDGSTVTGTDILAFLAVAESMGVDGIGLNCSVGPKQLVKLAAILAKNTSLPISFKPNAGMPKLVNRQTVFPGTVAQFVAASVEAKAAGVNLLGGCCGTGPEYIRALANKLKGKAPKMRKAPRRIWVSSRTRALDLSVARNLVIIGERINPTNRKKFQEELFAGNFQMLRSEAKQQVTQGANILDINLGLPGADEKTLMKKAVEEIQEVVSAPLCIDSSSIETIEAGVRACAGKPIINSVNGDKEKLDRILPLAKRYGAVVIGLTTDEKGLPKTAIDRLTIAKRIIAAAKKVGLKETDIIFDYLTLSVSAMPGQAVETLSAIRRSKKLWPAVKTVLGLSNISFGLPDRKVINSTFLKMARASGLDLAILNPYDKLNLEDKYAKRLLLGRDPAGKKYIETHSAQKPAAVLKSELEKSPETALYEAVIDGNRETIKKIVESVASTGKAPLAIANDILLKALQTVGERFNRKEYFLPQVILSAEAAQAAFGVIKPLLKNDSSYKGNKIVLATVKGDVHDIGKNIVAAVFESHGWEVIDLGKNVTAETIVKAAKTKNAEMIGLSALMTTTMPQMEQVVKERNEQSIPSKIIVGGAPVTKKFADEIGADGFAKDAIEAVNIANLLLKK